MNIIQLQDRLKGMPDEAIIQYVQNPTGEVPTYLALGELQRRKSMRDKYEAMREPAPSVAEQIVEESMPQGLGALGEGAMQGMAVGQGLTSMPSEAPMPTPDQLASSGLGALPANNIGQNYAGGGIVAFEEGGDVFDPLGIDPFLMLPRRYDKDDPRFPGIFDDPIKSIQGDVIEDIKDPTIEGKLISDMEKESKKRKDEVKEEARKKQEQKDQLDIESQIEDKIRKSGDQDISPKTDVEKETAKTPMTDEERAAYLALAQAGFETMAGQSPFALSNLGAGAASGVKGYQEQLGKLQERRTAAATALAKAEQNARENRINVDKTAREYVEGIYGKPSELDDDVRILERNQAYQIRKAELLYELGYITQDQLKAAVNSVGTTGKSTVDVGGKSFKIIK